MSLLGALAVALGAALGALLRWGLGLWLNPAWPTLPLGTLAANLTGGYLVGLALAVFMHWPSIAPEWRLFLVTGLLGGLTTFSTFSAEVVGAMMRGEALWALLIAAAHLLGSLLMTWLGFMSLRALTSLA
ncbi:MAG: fluoride efflux transporter CrcB [Halothiobacillaceae bacterium]|nr:fluoride efflux transporter CrcB [Halothiobacillaceae bacterium]